MVASALIMWPIRFSATSYLLRAWQSGDGTERNLAFPAAGSLTIGRNYWVSGDGQADADGGVGGVGDLLTTLDATLQNDPSAQTFTCTLTNFRVQVTANTGTFRMEFGDAGTTLDDTIFGWTNADTSTAASHTSPNQPQGIWRPKRPVAIDSRDRQPLVSGIATALSGLQRVSALALPKKERDLHFKYLTNAQTLEEYELATEPYGSFEYFLNNSLRMGRAFRYYPDETALGTSDYTLYVPRDLEDPIKRNELHRLYWDAIIKARQV